VHDRRPVPGPRHRVRHDDRLVRRARLNVEPRTFRTSRSGSRRVGSHPFGRAHPSRPNTYVWSCCTQIRARPVSFAR
jgi:hypothetical protein